jgi:hypothetical protein
VPLLIRLLTFLGRNWKTVAIALGLIAAGKFVPWDALMQALKTLARFWWLIAFCIAILILAIEVSRRRKKVTKPEVESPRAVPKGGSRGLAVRLLMLTALTGVLVLTGFVFLENQEIKKIVPPSQSVYAAWLLGKCLAFCGVSYATGIHGKNFTDSVTELSLALAGSFIIVAVLGQHMFPITVDWGMTISINPFRQSDDRIPITTPDQRWLLLLVPAVFLLAGAATRIYRYHRSSL